MFKTTGNNFLMARQKGMTALPTVLLIGGVIIEIAIAGVFIVYFLGQSSFGVKWSAEALAAGRTGVYDAVLKIVREKNFSTGATPYTLAVGNHSVQIWVCLNSKTAVSYCDVAATGKYEITSLGNARNKYRRLRAFLNVNDVNGEVKVESISEIAL